jgi:DNA (cytosine-5)-methyltransferase 1
MSAAATILSPEAAARRSSGLGPAPCSPSRTHLDLFSGIGGFALAAQAAGYKTIGFSEINPYACKILKRHWPDVPNYGDIRNIKGVQCNLLTGGFPCQPFSVAGKRRGAEDDRHLWPEMCRVIAEARPSWVLGENVPGIVAMELDAIMSDLEGIGYACWPLIIPAVAVDARHRRDRLWLVAYSGSGEGKQRCGPEMLGRWSEETKQTRMGCGDVPDAACERGQENPDGRKPGQPVSLVGHTRTIWHEWPPEPAVGRVANGIPNRAYRLEGLGNAIVPQVAETLIRLMAKMENSVYTPTDSYNEQPDQGKKH